MFKNYFSTFKVLSTLGLLTIIGNISLGTASLISSNEAIASPGFFEYQWDPDPSYRRLKYFQSSNERLDRSTYFLFLRPKDRETAIIKLTIKVPDYFEAKLTPKKLSLCKVRVGGYTNRTACLSKIPARFEINQDQTSIDIFPEQPIPSNNENYALQMKIFNPRKIGMYQFQAFSQAPGDVPVSMYIGTWNIDIQ